MGSRVWILPLARRHYFSSTAHWKDCFLSLLHFVWSLLRKIPWLTSSITLCVCPGSDTLSWALILSYLLFVFSFCTLKFLNLIQLASIYVITLLLLSPDSHLTLQRQETGSICCAFALHSVYKSRAKLCWLIVGSVSKFSFRRVVGSTYHQMVSL